MRITVVYSLPRAETIPSNAYRVREVNKQSRPGINSRSGGLSGELESSWDKW